MSSILSIYINGDKVLDYDKSKREPGLQRRFLDEMDLDMDKGIDVNGELLESPDKMQRANYVAMVLLYGIENNDEGMISATCKYLANRLPDLKQVRAIEQGNEISLDLIFN